MRKREREERIREIFDPAIHICSKASRLYMSPAIGKGFSLLTPAVIFSAIFLFSISYFLFGLYISVGLCVCVCVCVAVIRNARGNCICYQPD